MQKQKIKVLKAVSEKQQARCEEKWQKTSKLYKEVAKKQKAKSKHREQKEN